MLEVPVTVPADAVIVAFPAATAVTSPVAFTLATAWFDEDQVNVVADITFPLASRAVAVRRVVSPTAANVSDAGVTVTDETVGGGGGGGGGGEVPGSVGESEPPQPIVSNAAIAA